MGKRFRSGGRRKSSKHFKIAADVLAGFDQQSGSKKAQEASPEKQLPMKDKLQKPAGASKVEVPKAVASQLADRRIAKVQPEAAPAAAPKTPKRPVDEDLMDTKPFAPFEWMLSFRYLRAKRKESFASIISVISFLGITVGVMILISVLAIMNGFRADIMGRILGLSGHMDIIHIAGPMPDYDRVAERVRSVDGVLSAVPMIEENAMLVKRGALNGAVVRGMRSEDLKALTLVSDNIVQGRLEDFDKKNSIVIGDVVASIYGLGIGDKLTLMAAKGPSTPFGTVPQQKSYRVRAIFHVGERSADSGLVYMPLEQAQAFFSVPNHVHKIEVRVKNPDQIDAYQLPIQAQAGASFTLYDWQRKNSWLYGALQMERNVVAMIMGLILLIAALNIISGMVMLVKDKGRDIAVLRTMGATRGSIMRVFLISGASIGVAGTVAGFGLGLLVCYNVEEIRQAISALMQRDVFPSQVYLLDKMTAEINNGEVIGVLMFSLLLSFLAPLYPAWRAARIDPVEALRYE